MSLRTAALAAGATVAVAALVPTSAPPSPTGRETTLGGHENLVESLALAPNRDVLISSGWDQTIRFWNLDSQGADFGEEILKLPHGSQPYDVAPSPDGRYLAVGGTGGLTLWRSSDEGWSPLASKPGAHGRHLAFSPDSRSLAIGGEDGEIRIVAIPSLEETNALSGLEDMVHAVAFSPDGSIVAASSFAGEMALWDAVTGERMPTETPADRVQCFAFSRDGRCLATASWPDDGGGIALRDPRTGRTRDLLAAGEGFLALAFSPDGSVMAAAGLDRVIKLWDPRTGSPRGALTDTVGWVKTILFTDGGARLAYGGRDGAIRFRDLPASPEASTG